MFTSLMELKPHILTCLLYNLSAVLSDGFPTNKTGFYELIQEFLKSVQGARFAGRTFSFNSTTNPGTILVSIKTKPI